MPVVLRGHVCIFLDDEEIHFDINTEANTVITADLLCEFVQQVMLASAIEQGTSECRH